MTLFTYIWILISFSVTIICMLYSPIMPGWHWCLSALLVTVIGVRYRRFYYALGISSGMLVVMVHSNLFLWQAKLLQHSAKDITIIATVDSFFKKISHGYYGTVRVTSIDGRRLLPLFRPKIRLIAPVAPPLNGSVRFSVNIKPIYGLLNERGFDAERYAASHNIAASASVVTGSSWQITSYSSLRGHWLSRFITASEHLTTQPLLKALSFGLRDDISTPVWQGLQFSGLIHLISISGLHIGMAFAFGAVCGRVVRLMLPALPAITIVFGLGMAFIYAWLAGFSLPTLRAFIMCVIASLCILLRLSISRWQVLLLTLTITLFLFPFSALSTSFWLSFLAVCCVFWVMLQGRLPAVKGGLPRVVANIKAQVFLLLLLMPISGYFFSGVSIVSIIYNLVFVAWFTFLLVPAVFIALFGQWLSPDIAIWLWWCCDRLLMPLLWSLSLAQDGWFVVSINQWRVLAGCLLLVLIWPLITVKTRLLSLLLSFSWLYAFEPKENWRVDVFDVGHGLAVLISAQQRAVLYDTGKVWSKGSMAESVIAPVLARRGITHLDGLILSHYDADHAGGRDWIKQYLRPGWVRSSQREADHLSCIRGQSWHWQTLNFTVLWPPALTRRAYNSHSCVIRIADKHGFSVLLSGDIEALAEWLLVRQHAPLRSDIVLVPHHGSYTSSTRSFVTAVGAQVAIASLAKGNRWGMPNAEVVKRYQQQGARWLDTGDSGQISIVINGQFWKLNRTREQGFQPWYRQMLRKRLE